MSNHNVRLLTAQVEVDLNRVYLKITLQPTTDPVDVFDEHLTDKTLYGATTHGLQGEQTRLENSAESWRNKNLAQHIVILSLCYCYKAMI